MRIEYNSPVVLSFTLASCAVLGFSMVFKGFQYDYFALRGSFDFGNPMDYFRTFSHILGHGNWAHLVGNFAFILLIGPILEAKYGGKNLLMMILATALVTAVINSIFFSNGLLGASGIVFMMILLGSLVNVRSGSIPLTFILIVLLYIGREVYAAFGPANNISEFGHILGGICGTFFGFTFNKKV